jgi:hypothetical protein
LGTKPIGPDGQVDGVAAILVVGHPTNPGVFDSNIGVAGELVNVRGCNDGSLDFTHRIALSGRRVAPLKAEDDKERDNCG